MGLLDWRFAGSERNVLQLIADLDRGWRDVTKQGNKNNHWGFDQVIKADYQRDSFFRCHLCVVALAPHSWQSAQTFPARRFSGTLEGNPVSVDGSTMIIDIPLNQPWRPSKQGRPFVFGASLRPFTSKTTEGIVGYRIQLLVVQHGADQMFVKNEYEWGDGFAWVGGRPESNRRKF